MKNILLLISQGVEILEVSPFIDVFGWNMIVGKKDTFLTTCSFHDIINCTWNIKILPEVNLKDTKLNLEIYDTLVIPGGFGKAGFFNDMKTTEFQNIIKYFHSQDKIILGVCTGVIALGESGILKNRKATTYLLDNDRYFRQLLNFGPYIPIYGFGAVIIMIIISRFIAEPDKSNKFNIRPLKIFLLILILSTFAELIGSYIMEYTLGLVLWDYSNEWMNFQGRISPRTSFIFAAGGTAVFYTIQPLGKKLIDRISVKGQKIFASILLTLVLIDFSASLVTTIWFSDSIKKAGIIERK